MKTTTLVLGICLLFCISSCSQDFKKLNNSEVDKSKVKLAQDFASDFFNKLKVGETYQFKNEATELIKNQFSEKVQRATYEQLKNGFGEFISVEYTEAWIQNSDKTNLIVRLKAKFEKSKKKLELRVVINKSNNVSGFWVKPWSDMLK